MNSRFILKSAIILIISIALNWFSILLSPYASPDDLGQLAFIMVIFFPAAAFITGMLAHRFRLGVIAAAVISAVSAAGVILIKYNSSGLSLSLVYAAVAIAGYWAAWGVEAIIKKIKSRA